MTRILLWLGDLFAPDDLDFRGLGLLSYHISDAFYRLAWTITEAAPK